MMPRQFNNWESLIEEEMLQFNLDQPHLRIPTRLLRRRTSARQPGWVWFWFIWRPCRHDIGSVRDLSPNRRTDPGSQYLVFAVGHSSSTYSDDPVNNLSTTLIFVASFKQNINLIYFCTKLFRGFVIYDVALRCFFQIQALSWELRAVG